MVPFRDIIRGAVSRFLPGWLLTLVAVPLVFAPKSLLELGPVQFGLLTDYTVAAVSGYVASLFVMRHRLRTDADVLGRKGVVAGASSVGALLITSLLPHGLRSYVTIATIYFTVSAGVTLALYAPWLRSKAGSPQTEPEAAV